MKILWVHNYKEGTNSGLFMFETLKGFKQQCPEIKIELHYIKNLKTPKSFYKELKKLRNIENNFDLIHAQYGSGIGLLVSLLHSQKTLTLRGSDWYIVKKINSLKLIKNYLGNLFTRLALKRFKHIFVVSERMKNEILIKFPHLSFSVIPSGIDRCRFKPKPKPNKNTHIKKILFSTVDTNNPIKRYQLAYKAFKHLQNRVPNSEIVFLNGIEHSKVPDTINQVDLTLLTSTHEGWPNIIKESLACNIPFVSTDVSDLMSLSTQTKNCFVCKDDYIELGNKMFESLNQPSEDLRKHSLSFDNSTIYQKFCEAYASNFSRKI